MEEINNLKLTPAESYFIQDPKQADGKNLMKYSLLHLIYKKILVSEVIEEEEGLFTKNKVNITYIDRYEKFTMTGLKPHESIFCSAINYSEKMKLRTLIEKVGKKYSFSKYHKLIQNQLIQDGVMVQKEKKFWIFKYKRPELSELGQDIQKKINNILKIGKENLESWVKNNPPKAKAYMQACGVNLFILGEFSPATLRTWNTELKDVEKESDSSFMYWGDSGVNRLNDMDSMDGLASDFDGMNAFDAFDSFDSFDADGGGCGGGCSGGGCGGGCGG